MEKWVLFTGDDKVKHAIIKNWLWASERMFYLGPQLPKEREAVGLFPRVSFRSCLRRQKSGKVKMRYLEDIKRIFAYSVTDFGMGSLSKSINWLSSLNWFTYLEGKVIYFVHVQIGDNYG